MGVQACGGAWVYQQDQVTVHNWVAQELYIQLCISVSSWRDVNGHADTTGLLHVVLRVSHARRI